MKTTIYLEGGGDTRDLKSRCREGFHKLLLRCGFAGRMPHLVACGGRDAAFDDFKTGLAHAKDGDFVGLWIDSEDPMADIKATWSHLKTRDNWDKPDGATDEQVLLMTACMGDFDCRRQRNLGRTLRSRTARIGAAAAPRSGGAIATCNSGRFSSRYAQVPQRLCQRKTLLRDTGKTQLRKR